MIGDRAGGGATTGAGGGTADGRRQRRRDGSRKRHGGRDRRRGVAQRGLEIALVLLHQQMDGAVRRLLALQKLPVQLGRLLLHFLQGVQAFARLAQRLLEGRRVGRRRAGGVSARRRAVSYAKFEDRSSWVNDFRS